MSRITVQDGVALFYEDLGEGPPVIFIHGGFMNHQIWETQVTALLKSGFRVITFDLRGHGRSDKPMSSYTSEMYASDLEAFQEALEIEKVALVGWSLGATVATAYASRYPDRLTHLCLVSTGIFDGLAPASSEGEDEHGLDIDRLLAHQRTNRPEGMAAYVERMVSDDADERMKDWLWEMGMQTPQRVALKTLEIYLDPDYSAMGRTLSSLSVPGAVFHGTDDEAASLSAAEHVAMEVLNHGTFVLFEKSGHVPFLTETGRFNQQLIDFLRM